MSPDGRPGVQISTEMLRSAREQALQIVSANLEEARTQHPLDIPEILEYDRPSLNGRVPISLYRAVRLLALRDVLGVRIAAAILTRSGRILAAKMGVKGVDEILQAFGDLGIAKATVERRTDRRAVISAEECATCAGVPSIGEPMCSFEGGFIAGALEGDLGEYVRVTETRCWGLGDRICTWEARAGSRQRSGDGADSLEPVMTLVTKAADAIENGLAVRIKNRELRQAYEQLRESERMKKDLTDMIVHDMRVPMTAVMGSIETLADMMDERLTAREQRVMEMALASGREVVNMIGDLLDISRLEEQKPTIKKAPVSVFEIVDKAIRQVAVIARRKGIELRSEIETGMPKIEADGARMVRVLMNLLSNAVQHTPSGGSIAVIARHAREEGLALVSVCDTGEGISAEFHDRIFDKFVQVDSQRTRRRTSTGLGLAFCKLVTEAHGGSIQVKSTPGAGSTFTISLPA